MVGPTSRLVNTALLDHLHAGGCTGGGKTVAGTQRAHRGKQVYASNGNLARTLHAFHRACSCVKLADKSDPGMGTMSLDIVLLVATGKESCQLVGLESQSRNAFDNCTHKPCDSLCDSKILPWTNLACAGPGPREHLK